jgi:hypothetical protein
MSKIKLICFICISLLFFGTSVQANLRSSQNDFTTKFRKEKLISGGPGQQVNILMEVDQGFNFDSEVEIIQTGYPSHEPPSPEPPLPEPPSPEPPLPLTILPMT